MDDPEDPGSDDGAPAEDASAPRIDEEVALATVARAESTKSYLLAQTLESTKTVPVVSAKLSLQGEGPDEVLGSFTYRGITYAVEPGGESVAIVAADPSKLPSDFLDAQTIVLPSSVSSDGIDSYSVTRIADGAFSSLAAPVAKGSQDAFEGVGVAGRNGSDAASASDRADAPDADGAVRGASGTDGADPAPSAKDDGSSDGEASATSITAITIPSSITTIEEGAFAGFETLRYIIVSSDNPEYSMYDGCLYDKSQESLLLIPGGRQEGVRVPRVTKEVSEGASSHCAFFPTLLVDADSPILASWDDGPYFNRNGDPLDVLVADDERDRAPLAADYSKTVEVEAGETLELVDALPEGRAVSIACSDEAVRAVEGEPPSIEAVLPGESTIALVDAASADPCLALMTVTVSSLDRPVGSTDPVDRETAEPVTSGSSEPASAAIGLTEETIQQRAVYDATTNTTTLRIGERDGSGNPTGSGGDLLLRKASTTSYAYFISSRGGCWADVTWTGGGTAPAIGSIVNFNVLKLHQNGNEATIETATATSLIYWGASESKEFVGIRNPDTGSHISLEAIQGGGEFTFSFIMPASGCTLNSGGMTWSSSPFQPVLADRQNATINHFDLSAPSGKTAQWRNAGTGILVSGFIAATYSNAGSTLITPQHAIPYCDGYTFMGWYTKGVGGSAAPPTTTDTGITYYAHWGATSSTKFVIGERDSSGNPTGSGGILRLRKNSAGEYAYFISSSNGCWADITWTGNDAFPAAGSTVNVNVLQLHQNGNEATVETAINTSLVYWGASATKEFIGIYSPETGSYISMETIQGGGAFSFSFIMPASNCTLSTAGMEWAYSPFEPVFTDREDAVINRYELNSPSGRSAKWRNANTGVLANNYPGATYSDKGKTLATPQYAIPYCDGYTFTGWYTAKNGGDPAPAITTDEGATYYAHWGETSPNKITIGGRDESGNPSGSGGQLMLRRNHPGSYAYFISSSSGCWADVTWTGGGAIPAAGSVVNVNVLKLQQTGNEATIETALNTSLIYWGASATKEFVGIRNPETGSFASLEAIQGAGAFTLSFVMPASGCTISSGGMAWASSPFEPVMVDRQAAIINRFVLNAPSGKSVRWRNASTGILTSNEGFSAATYSEKGSSLIVPENAIPYCEGYTFLGWYTAAEGGVPAPAMTTDEGATYYAHWGNEGSKFYYVQKYDNIPGSGALVQNTNPVGYGYSFSDFIFERAGHSIVRWAENADGSGKSYDVNATYPAPAEGTWITGYAQWALDRYSISYELAGGTWEGTAGPDHYDYDASATVSVPDPVRVGYDFAGWMGTGLDEATVGLELDAGSNDKLGEHEAGTNLYARTYTATWTPHTYKMSFDLAFDDGSASWKDGEAPDAGAYDAVVYDTAVSFPKAPVRAGWIFDSWARTDEPSAERYAAEEIVDRANFESEQDAIASFEAHWVKNLKVTVPLGSKDVDMAVSADLVDGAEFDVDKGEAQIVNLSDGELKVVSVREDASDADALAARRANALEAFGGTSSDASKLDAVSFVLRPTSDGTTADASKEEARFELFGSHAFETDSWRIAASTDPINGTDASTLRILYDLAFDYTKIALTDLKLNLDAKPISSLVYTVELVDRTEPSYSTGA